MNGGRKGRRVYAGRERPAGKDAVSLFDEETVAVRARPVVSRSAQRGIWALAVALAALLGLTVLPSAYVIQQPGPVFDTLGAVTTSGGEEVPLIQIEGAETFPTAGTLDLLTVQLVGNRERTPSWFELAQAWLDSSKAVIPLDDAFPKGQSTEDRNEESAAMMVDSQKEATAAALAELGYDVGSMVRVFGLTDDAAAAGILEKDDVILAANGETISQTERLREIVAEGEGAPVRLDIDRAGRTQTVEVTPAATEIGGQTRWLLGITTLHDYDFPFDVTIQLDNVGGPSAGMMFALGIIDTLTEGNLNGGKDVAGTGTIDANGVVGPIGGIRQKMHGALGAGAEYFLAPVDNCPEVVGHVPRGLDVFAVGSLDEALDVMATLRGEKDAATLPRCD